MQPPSSPFLRLTDMSNRQHACIDLARRTAAAASDSPCFRHGAVLTMSGRVISSAANTSKHSAFGMRFRLPGLGDATRHAEVSCILGIDRSLTEGATVFVVRINKEGLLRMSRPCRMCQECMRFVGIKEVIYSIDPEHFGSLRL